MAERDRKKAKVEDEDGKLEALVLALHEVGAVKVRHVVLASITDQSAIHLSKLWLGLARALQRHSGLGTC